MLICGSLLIILLYKVWELEVGGSMALAVGVSDMWQLTWDAYPMKNHIFLLSLIYTHVFVSNNYSFMELPEGFFIRFRDQYSSDKRLISKVLICDQTSAMAAARRQISHSGTRLAAFCNNQIVKG